MTKDIRVGAREPSWLNLALYITNQDTENEVREPVGLNQLQEYYMPQLNEKDMKASTLGGIRIVCSPQ